jgi:hypothetical protein
MGIDWVRARVPRDADSALLGRLIEQQAVAFQSMRGWHSDACYDYDGVQQALQERLHLEAYRAASDALHDLLEFPEWDENRLCAKDIPDFDPCWRVYPITNNPAYPPLWRLRAHRTFVPEQLGAQIAEWKRWAEQVVGAKHEGYLRELHLMTTSDFMLYHWLYLRRKVTAVVSRTDSADREPALTQVCEKILQLPEPVVTDAHIDPADEERDTWPQPNHWPTFDFRYDDLFDELRVLLDLTREWNSRVPEDSKVPYGEETYHLTLEGFRECAREPWLQEFFSWADRCAEGGFALYLDG